jgi:hypothetical protein
MGHHPVFDLSLRVVTVRVKASDRQLADWILSRNAGATPVDLADDGPT